MPSVYTVKSDVLEKAYAQGVEAAAMRERATKKKIADSEKKKLVPVSKYGDKYDQNGFVLD